MAINWYPGHMHKARKQIHDILPKIDVLIEMVDARIPFSSQNPAIAEFKQSKPCIMLLSKADLADPDTLSQWQNHWEKDGIKTLAISTKEPGAAQQLPQLIRKLAPNSASATRKIQALIVGIPNVGKSTLINKLTGRTAAKVGNEPAVTKAQQKIHLSDDIVLNDTPGILWPKFENSHSGYRLAITGAIRDTAIEYDDIALYAAHFLGLHYGEFLRKRYQLSELPDLTKADGDIELLELIGRARGAKAAGGRVDFYKAAEVLIHDFRNGSIGGICLENPDMIQQELITVAEIATEKAEKKAAEKAARKKKHSGKRY